MTDPALQPLPSLAGNAWLVRAETQSVFAALRTTGHDARAVGGAVRNALLGERVGDVDIATPAKPADVIGACEAAGLKCVPTGIDHGTVTVIANDVAFEVTTLREDVETFGRHANVAFTENWAADARRRDFTFNALYCDADGRISDPLGGYPDLVARRVRFIGDPRERIREDYLRILRFFRFHAEYGQGEPDRDALDACVRERAGLAILSAERVRAEVVKLLAASGALASIGSMTDFGLLAPLLQSAPRPALFAALVARERELGLAPDAMLRLSALAVAVEEDVDALSRRLRLSNAERDDLLVVDARLGAMASMPMTTARRTLYRLRPQRWQRAIAAAGAAAGRDGTDAHWRTLFDLPQQWTAPAFPLRGSDVLALGIEAGPRVGELLQQLEDWWVALDFAADEAGLRAQLMRLAQSPAAG